MRFTRFETYLEDNYTDRLFREMVDCRNIGRANKGAVSKKCCGRNYLHLRGMLNSKSTRLAMQIAKGTTEMHFQEIDEMEIERLHIVFVAARVATEVFLLHTHLHGC